MYTKKELLMAWNMFQRGMNFKDVEEILNVSTLILEDNLNETLLRVCNYFGVDIDNVKDNNRLQELVYAREFFAYYAIKKLNANQKEIADLLGKERSTITHYHKKIKGLLEVNDSHTTATLRELKAFIEKRRNNIVK